MPGLKGKRVFSFSLAGVDDGVGVVVDGGVFIVLLGRREV